MITIEVDSETVKEIGYDNRYLLHKWFIKASNGCKHTYKTLEDMRYRLRNNFNQYDAEKLTRELRGYVEVENKS